MRNHNTCCIHLQLSATATAASLGLLKGNIRPGENSPDEKHLGLSCVLLNTWKLILQHSVAAAGISAKPSLQEGLTSLDNLRDNRAWRFLHNVHTWTGNRLFQLRTAPAAPPAHGRLRFVHSRIVSEACAAPDSAMRAPGPLTPVSHSATNFLFFCASRGPYVRSKDASITPLCSLHIINLELRSTADTSIS